MAELLFCVELLQTHAADMGGFQVPLGLLGECTDEESLWSLVTELIEKRIARVVPDLEKKLQSEGRQKSESRQKPE